MEPRGRAPAAARRAAVLGRRIPALDRVAGACRGAHFGHPVPRVGDLLPRRGRARRRNRRRSRRHRRDVRRHSLRLAAERLPLAWLDASFVTAARRARRAPRSVGSRSPPSRRGQPSGRGQSPESHARLSTDARLTIAALAPATSPASPRSGRQPGRHRRASPERPGRTTCASTSARPGEDASPRRRPRRRSLGDPPADGEIEIA